MKTTVQSGNPVYNLLLRKSYWNIAISTHLYIVYGCVMLQRRSWVVKTENMWPTKPKIFTVWLFTEKNLSNLGVEYCASTQMRKNWSQEGKSQISGTAERNAQGLLIWENKIIGQQLASLMSLRNLFYFSKSVFSSVKLYRSAAMRTKRENA